MHTLLAVIAITMNAYAGIRYLHSARTKGTLPVFSTWALLAVITGSVAAAGLLHGGGSGSYTLLAFAVMNGVIAAHGWHNRAVSRRDWVCAAAALVSLIGWWSTGSELAAVLLLSAASAVSYWPTIRRSWDHPHLEPLSVYALNTIRYGITAFAVVTPSFVTLLYPVLWVGINAGMVALLWTRSRVTALAVTVEAYNIDRDNGVDLAALHLSIRRWQEQVGENKFPDILDSHGDLSNPRGFYQTPGGNFFIARNGDTLVGFVGLKRVGDTGHVKRLAVLPEYQGRGIGDTLVGELVAWARTQGFTHLELLTGSRERGRGLYARHGFTVTGTVAKGADFDWHMINPVNPFTDTTTAGSSTEATV